MAKYGMALTVFRTVIPGYRLPVKRASTDGGISSGIKPRAAAKATKPEPDAFLSCPACVLPGNHTLHAKKLFTELDAYNSLRGHYILLFPILDTNTR